MKSENIEIINKLGLHARAAAKLVKTASQFQSDVKIYSADQQADAKSIMSVMMLAAGKGSQIRIDCEGSDEKEAMNALVTLIEDYFGEEE